MALLWWSCPAFVPECSGSHTCLLSSSVGVGTPPRQKRCVHSTRHVYTRSTSCKQFVVVGAGVLSAEPTTAQGSLSSSWETRASVTPTCPCRSPTFVYPVTMTGSLPAEGGQTTPFLATALSSWSSENISAGRPTRTDTEKCVKFASSSAWGGENRSLYSPWCLVLAD